MRKVVPRPNRDNAKDGPLVFVNLHESIDDFMNGSISSHGDDHVITLLPRLFCQFYGMTGINGAAPVHASVLFCDGTQVTGDAPSVSHVCHGVEDDFDFAGHGHSPRMISWIITPDSSPVPPSLLSGKENRRVIGSDGEMMGGGFTRLRFYVMPAGLLSRGLSGMSRVDISWPDKARHPPRAGGLVHCARARERWRCRRRSQFLISFRREVYTLVFSFPREFFQ